MLSRLDEIIYPNRCEVIEIEPSQRYIYPIFKNGSSSIITYANQCRYKILFNEQLQKLDTIDIVLRNPVERFISGIKTFVGDTKTENPTLDELTILWFAENYLFLNRHYAPQLSWLINLNRYTKAKFRFYSMDHLTEFTPLQIKPIKETLLIDDSVITQLSNNVHNEMYLRLDNLLLNLIGEELTFAEILVYLKQQDYKAFQKLTCTALD